MADHPPVSDPENYPHTLTQDQTTDHVILVSKRGDGSVKRSDLGDALSTRTAYARYRHLLDDHSRNEANLFLWGLMTGIGVYAAWELERLLADRP